MSASSRLNSGLRSSCAALRQVWDSTQYHITDLLLPFPHTALLLSSSHNMSACLKSCSSCARLQPPSGARGISSCWRSMRPKAWTAIPVLGRPVWVEVPAQAGCSASVCVSASALQLRCMDTIFCQEDTVSSKTKTKPKKGKTRAHLGNGSSFESFAQLAPRLFGLLPCSRH